MREAQKFLPPAPTVLAEAASLGLKSLAEARKVWAKWTALRDVQEAGGLADGLESHASEFARVLGALIEEAEAEAKRREDVWAPLAIAIAEWLPKARVARRAATTIDDLKQAESWWKDASAAWRDERFTPVADRAMAVWKRLRLQSNVDLGGIGLEGDGTATPRLAQRDRRRHARRGSGRDEPGRAPRSGAQPVPPARDAARESVPLHCDRRSRAVHGSGSGRGTRPRARGSRGGAPGDRLHPRRPASGISPSSWHPGLRHRSDTASTTRWSSSGRAWIP